MTAAAHPPHASIPRIAHFATLPEPRPGTLAPAIARDFTTKGSRRKHRGRIQHDSPRKYGSARMRTRQPNAQRAPPKTNLVHNSAHSKFAPLERAKHCHLVA